MKSNQNKLFCFLAFHYSCGFHKNGVKGLVLECIKCCATKTEVVSPSDKIGLTFVQDISFVFN